MLDTLLSHLRSVAPNDAPVSLLQPADPFLETAGEDLRRRVFLSETADGALKCLRPEFTIPVCLHHLQNGKGPARYACGGTVFRQARSGNTEFEQVGLEDLGNPDTVAADAACLTDMVQTLGKAGIEDFSITLGDREVFAVLVSILDLPDAIAERLNRNFGEPDALNSLINGLTKANGDFGIDAEIKSLLNNEEALAAHIYQSMSEAGISSKSGRSPQDIARRMIDKANEANFVLDQSKADILLRFLTIEGSLNEAPAMLANFAASESMDFGSTLDEFQRRADAIAASDIDLKTITYRASFGRKIDYYTGVLFEAHLNGQSEPIAGGGRYDRLCSLLGAPEAIPAVGFSIMLDRLDAERDVA